MPFRNISQRLSHDFSVSFSWVLHAGWQNEIYRFIRAMKKENNQKNNSKYSQHFVDYLYEDDSFIISREPWTSSLFPTLPLLTLYLNWCFNPILKPPAKRNTWSFGFHPTETVIASALKLLHPYSFGATGRLGEKAKLLQLPLGNKFQLVGLVGWEETGRKRAQMAPHALLHEDVSTEKEKRF